MLKPEWLRVKAPQRERIGAVADLLLDLKLNTVCQEASCPNIGECFAGGTATFLIMGPGCTRACPYCDIDFDKSVRALDPTEPERLGEAVARLGLKHVVITSVNRDDLADGGASQFVACIEQVKQRSPLTTIELLIPDFCGNWDALASVMAAAPHVLNHNIETVPRMYRLARPQGIYERSLELLQRVRQGWPSAYSKSGLMVGLGETDDEVIATTVCVHLAHCLRRARLLATANTRIDQLQKLHSWGVKTLEKPDDIKAMAESLFAADDVAVYSLPEETEKLGSRTRLVSIVKGKMAPESITGLEVRRAVRCCAVQRSCTGRCSAAARKPTTQTRSRSSLALCNGPTPMTGPSRVCTSPPRPPSPTSLVGSRRTK